MAEWMDSGDDDRTEDATPERREEFREKGRVAVSREITSVAMLLGTGAFVFAAAGMLVQQMTHMLVASFESLGRVEIHERSLGPILERAWKSYLWVTLPVCGVSAAIAVGTTLLQTRFNWSWERLAPDFSKMNPLTGLQRMVGLSSTVELAKGVGKLAAVGLVAYLILMSEWARVPGLMQVVPSRAWNYWGEITQDLFWAVGGLMFVIAAGDYFYSFMSLEGRLKMTKREVKEEYRRREVDPHVKGRLRRMARDLTARKMVEKTRKATVLITNPTHYSIALQYEVNMAAPKLIAKGVDHLALRMREVAKELDIPIVENKPLAQTLYKVCEVDQEIPESLYKAVSEIVRFVFRLKGIRVPKRAARTGT